MEEAQRGFEESRGGYSRNRAVHLDFVKFYRERAIGHEEWLKMLLE